VQQNGQAGRKKHNQHGVPADAVEYKTVISVDLEATIAKAKAWFYLATVKLLLPRKPEGELYTGIVRQISVGIMTKDPRRTLFIKYQPNTPGLYRAAYRD
jgi:hypothetical protein